MTVAPHVELVITGAPLARHATRIAADVIADGWTVSAVLSASAMEWLDTAALADVTGRQAKSQSRAPDEPRDRPRPGAVLLIPGTFNSLNKVRHGISDTPALGVLNDAVGTRTPLLVVPMISERLVDHPAWRETHAWLVANEIAVLDPQTGRLDQLQPLASGTGDGVARGFDTAMVTRWLKELR